MVKENTISSTWTIIVIAIMAVNVYIKEDGNPAKRPSRILHVGNLNVVSEVSEINRDGL